MSFWARMFSAVICWSLTMLALVAVAHHYLLPIPHIPQAAGLGLEIAAVVSIGATAIAAMVGALVFWLWVWARRYW